MTVEVSEVTWLESRTDYTILEVVEMSGLPKAVLDELVACGALPVDEMTRFEAESILLARAAWRLREHFEIEHEGLAVAVSLLRRVRQLEARLAIASAPDRDD